VDKEKEAVEKEQRKVLQTLKKELLRKLEKERERINADFE
jgi:hypothetical protein